MEELKHVLVDEENEDTETLEWFLERDCIDTNITLRCRHDGTDWDIAEITPDGYLDLCGSVDSNTGLRLDKNERIVIKRNA